LDLESLNGFLRKLEDFLENCFELWLYRGIIIGDLVNDLDVLGIEVEVFDFPSDFFISFMEIFNVICKADFCKCVFLLGILLFLEVSRYYHMELSSIKTSSMTTDSEEHRHSMGLTSSLSLFHEFLHGHPDFMVSWINKDINVLGLE
jgi:hypothetical protein